MIERGDPYEIKKKIGFCYIFIIPVVEAALEGCTVKEWKQRRRKEKYREIVRSVKFKIKKLF